MKIDDGFKSLVTMNNMMGKYKENYKNLFKLYNSRIDSDFDRWYIIYSLSLVSKKMGLIHQSKMYIEECLRVLNDFKGKSYEKGCTIWLYIELFKKELDDTELLKKYESLKDYFLCFGEDSYMYFGAEANIYILNNDIDNLIKLIEKCLSNRNKDEHYIEVVTNILSCTFKNNVELYSKINNYLNEINVKFA